MRLRDAVLLAAAGVSLIACSDDHDNAPSRPSGKAIVFNATAPRASRSVITTGSLNNFRVTAFVNGQKYMDNVSVWKSDGGWTYTPMMYWPADASVNFFSYAPGVRSEGDVSLSENGPADLDGFVNSGTTDLLYGVNMNESGATTNMVKINFRHALSQVRFTFRRKDEAPAIRVDVRNVDLIKINSEGNFQFPRETTSQGSAVTGKWSGQSAYANPVIYNGGVVTLTDSPQELLSTGYIFAIPQTLEPSELKGTTRKGSYVRVLCSIYHEDTGVKLWPSKEGTHDYDSATGCGYLYFPLDGGGAEGAVSGWESGKAYVYNIEIGVPNNAAAIQFDVTVDEYIDFADVNMGN